jgi:hypothetical protein
MVNASTAGTAGWVAGPASAEGCVAGSTARADLVGIMNATIAARRITAARIFVLIIRMLQNVSAQTVSCVPGNDTLGDNPKERENPVSSNRRKSALLIG